jgi:hypothetical protein
MSIPQGDTRLLDSAIALRLLAAPEIARLAYVAKDGTPRVFPMMYHWDGTEIVFATFAGAAKINALRTNPAVAISIDKAGAPPEVLLLRGKAEVTDVDGIVPEYRLAQEHYLGPELGGKAVADVDRPGTRMARIAVRPSWVGVLDFQERFPGGGGAEDFARRGQL